MQKKLKTKNLITAIVIAGCTLAMVPNTAAIEASATEQKVATTKMSMDSVYENAEINMEYQAQTAEYSIGTSSRYYVTNMPGWMYNVNYFVTRAGVNISYIYLKPEVMNILTSGSDYVMEYDATPEANYYFVVNSCGTTEENMKRGYISLTDLQENMISWASDPEIFNVGSEYVDYVDEGNSIRYIFNYDYVSASGIPYKCYSIVVERKDSYAIYQFDYRERADLFDKTRALTVAYSCLPV